MKKIKIELIYCNNDDNKEYEGDGDTSCNWSPRDSPQSQENGLEELKISRSPLIKISKNTKKSPEDLRRLGGTLTSVENHQFEKLARKNNNENKNEKKDNCMDISSDKLRKLHTK